MKPRHSLLAVLPALAAYAAFSAYSMAPLKAAESGPGEDTTDLRGRDLANPLAYVPPQCYTRTRDDAGAVHNPCFTCHQASREPNYAQDGDLQRNYDFRGTPGGRIANPWTNLFKDRSDAIAAIDDDAILAYAREDNYRAAEGSPQITRALTTALPAWWDANGNGRWDGFLPDAGFQFDKEGFDHRADGAYTGWRALAYAPFPGTFWPTNGSTDDVLIRLAPPFWQTEAGQPDLTVYKTNFAILTAMIQQRDVPLDAPVDETALKVDLDKDGKLGSAGVVRYDWAPLKKRYMSYVGLARAEQAAGRLHLAAGLFPEGTEFLHSVRYLDLDEHGNATMAARLKELRYAAKKSWYTYSDLKEMALKEVREKVIDPERTRQFSGNAEAGLSNGQGWVYQGFIEDRQGRLRPQNYEETAFCIGCHSGIGATSDGIFSFPRKFAENSFQHGWYHWTQKGLAGTPEPLRRDGQPEYAYYLAQNHAADEFRENSEAMGKFFAADGSLKAGAVAGLRKDIATLLLPSGRRALALDKAYKQIVDEQSYVLGRDASLAPARNVLRDVGLGESTGVTEVLEGP